MTSQSGTSKSGTKNASKSRQSKQPELDINKLINIAFDLCCRRAELSAEEWDKAKKEAINEAMKEVKPYAEHHLKKHAAAAVSAGISAAGIKELANQTFSSELVDSAQQIGIWVSQYMKKEISEEAFVSKMTGPGNQKLAKDLLAGLRIDEKMGVSSVEEIFKLSYPLMAYTASMAAYKELRKAQEKYEEAQDERVRIEKACAESVAMIRQYREEMERMVFKYLTEHLEIFETGFAAMNQAIMDGDVDGYIKGNVEIQRILGFDTQFTNQQEFDVLMDSDIAFKL